MEVVVERLSKTLVRQAKRARRDPEAFEEQGRAGQDGAGEILERIRANHRKRQPKL